ncbi:MAG: hypothetical protein P4L81_01780 [Candidatus Pacebacteria bacterium]|nr:hypothetical protein [Candidatus Paceibacterota bacterium]
MSQNPVRQNLSLTHSELALLMPMRLLPAEVVVFLGEIADLRVVVVAAQTAEEAIVVPVVGVEGREP